MQKQPSSYLDIQRVSKMADAREAYKTAARRNTKPNLSVKKDGKEDAKRIIDKKLNKLISDRARRSR